MILFCCFAPEIMRIWIVQQIVSNSFVSKTIADLDITETLHHRDKKHRKHEVEHLIVQQPSDSTIEESALFTTRNSL